MGNKANNRALKVISGMKRYEKPPTQDETAERFGITRICN